MKRFYKNILWIATLLVSVAFVACSGSSDEDDNEIGDGILRITVDKTEIKADGVDKVTFTIKLGKKDVSEESTMNLIQVKESGEVDMAYGVRAFSAVVPGTYVFKARYYDGGEILSENQITVTATAVSGGADYYHKLLGMQFTSVGCPNCPKLASSLKLIMAEKPGRIALAAFHMYYKMEDPMAIPETNNYRTKILGNFSGLPYFFFNMRVSGVDMISDKSQIEGELQNELANYPPTCGVAIQSSYDKATRKVSVTGKVTSNVKNSYRFLVYLVEDGIEAFQSEGGNNYVHNNVVRAVLVTSSLIGDRFPNELEPGIESSLSRDCTLNESWNADNMRIIVCALTTLDGGKTYTCNNVNECKLGESVDYLYNE
ncbi:Omp28-related outer membrane protein [Bacteroides sp.]